MKLILSLKNGGIVQHNEIGQFQLIEYTCIYVYRLLFLVYYELLNKFKT